MPYQGRDHPAVPVNPATERREIRFQGRAMDLSSLRTGKRQDLTPSFSSFFYRNSGMHIFDAEPQLVEDLLGETEILTTHQHPAFSVHAGRHPTLGRLVIVQARDGSGSVVETDE
jgi:hypothetical protein